jgi:hypothetical protein
MPIFQEKNLTFLSRKRYSSCLLNRSFSIKKKLSMRRIVEESVPSKLSVCVNPEAINISFRETRPAPSFPSCLETSLSSPLASKDKGAEPPIDSIPPA